MLFFLFLTELNNAFQYMWEKLFGKHKIVPKISPKITLKELLGEIITFTLFSIALVPLLTPFNTLWATLVGIFISIGGFFGDVTMSALKRGMKIKDFSTLLPGHIGILDRIDSLIFTALLFFI